MPSPTETPSELPARGTPAPCGEDNFVPDQQVNDLRKGMKALIGPILATGYAQGTFYGEAWKAANAYAMTVYWEIFQTTSGSLPPCRHTS